MRAEQVTLEFTSQSGRVLETMIAVKNSGTQELWWYGPLISLTFIDSQRLKIFPTRKYNFEDLKLLKTLSNKCRIDVPRESMNAISLQF